MLTVMMDENGAFRFKIDVQGHYTQKAEFCCRIRETLSLTPLERYYKSAPNAERRTVNEVWHELGELV